MENGFYIGHQMLGDVLGFCAAAHLYSLKIGKTIKVWFQPERKDATKYFDGVEWIPRDQIPNAIDCGGDPSLLEWPHMNGVKRFYRFMDSTLQAPKSFDVHFNIKKKESTKKIGLITHSNTQGDIPLDVVNEMITEAKKMYPTHEILLFGNFDNSIIPVGVTDFRQKQGDINWIIDLVSGLDLLIAPQTGPCFIAAGFKIPMWVYRSKEAFWDYTINYDEYKVQRWWDRKQYLYINWKTGLGDAILHLSCYYSYAKKCRIKMHWYGNQPEIERKMLELVDIYEKDQPDIKQLLIHVPLKTIKINGYENFIGYIPIPSDNCNSDYWVGSKDRFIHKFTKVINFQNKIIPYHEVDKAEYLKYSAAPANERYITMQLCGFSFGSWDNNYKITKEQILNQVQKMLGLGYKIKILGPFDDFCREISKNDQITLVNNLSIKDLFELISGSKLHIGIDSGIAHVALSCGVPYLGWKLIKSGGLAFSDSDFVSSPSFEEVSIDTLICNIHRRAGTTDDLIIKSIIKDNEYKIQKADISGKTIIDVGAHIGVFSVLCGYYGAREVLSFEPMVENVSLFRENTREYSCIRLVQAAIGRSDAKRKSIAFYSSGGTYNLGGGHIIYNFGDIVPVVALDDILSNYKSVDLIKFDCEGSEFPILFTSKMLPKIKRIIGEFHNFRRFDTRYSPEILDGYTIDDFTIEGLTKYLNGVGMDVKFNYHAGGIGFFETNQK